MKKLLGFLIVATLVACNCLSQIPDQLVYVDENCEALLPDYTPDVVVTDNCDNATVIQTPTPGTILTSAQPTTLVEITANDISGNMASIAFNVILIDTIPPTIEAGPGLLGYNEEHIGKIIQRMHQGVINMHDSILVQYPESNQDTSYRHDNLVIISNLAANYMPMQFIDPEWYLLGADSSYLADNCGLEWWQFKLEFVDPEDAPN